jgi:1-acyl-sn-glycerol-3-phosphate acyltransferase
VGDFPKVPKAVFIASPHTSNLDGLYMVATAFAMGVKLNWMGKKSLFRFPFAGFFRSVGGVAVDRSTRHNTVQQVANEFATRSSMFLAVAPAATRKKRDYWKSGFYHIALGANVPLLCGCIDWERKEAGIIGVVEPTGDPVVDMDRIRAIYEGRQGRHPERMSRMRLHAEDEVQERLSV